MAETAEPCGIASCRGVASPSPEYGPEPYYGLNGPVTIEQVERDLDTMKRLGFQAVTVQAGYNMPFAYLSPEYFAFFRKFVEEAKRRNMRVWIVDDAGYPSGFAGGRFSSMAPNLRMQALEVVQQIPVPGGAALQQALGPDVVSAAAVDAEGHAVPIALHGSELDWTAPSGQWTVLIVDHEFRTSPTRSDTNPKRVKDTTQSLEDYLNPRRQRSILRGRMSSTSAMSATSLERRSWAFAATSQTTLSVACPGRRHSSSGFARSRAMMCSRMGAVFADTGAADSWRSYSPDA